MKRVTRAGIALGFAAATAALSINPAQAATPAPGSTQQLCLGTPTPPGYVEIGWGYSCWMDWIGPSVKTVELVDGFPIGTQVTACANTPIPAGWTIEKSYVATFTFCPSVNGVDTVTLQRTS
ncbi:hypothetical protein [Kitasatospora sp. NPDC056531]|uniref:hypothetical protein n=1 Tax=Kitasatospora sp. NPDC056531 TaxID=3345856 RepID=UPI0036AF0F10